MTNMQLDQRGFSSTSTNLVRDKIRQLAFARTHTSFSQNLSGGHYSGVHKVQPGRQHQDKSDEVAVANFVGNFSKGLNYDRVAGLLYLTQYAAFKQAFDAQATNGLASLPESGSLAANDGFSMRPYAAALT